MRKNKLGYARSIFRINNRASQMQSVSICYLDV